MYERSSLVDYFCNRGLVYEFLGKLTKSDVNGVTPFRFEDDCGDVFPFASKDAIYVKRDSFEACPMRLICPLDPTRGTYQKREVGAPGSIKDMLGC